MKQIKFKKISKNALFLSAFFAVCAADFTGCTKEQKTQPAVTEEIQTEEQKTAVKLNSLDEQTKEYLSDKTIAVVLGHSYNDLQTVEKIRQLLNINYGVKTDETEALITILVYPEDFLVAGKPRISSIYSKLEDKNLAGIITFGAPEGLCNALARLEDLSIKRQEEGQNKKVLKRSYPVFSFFQQDDTLGSESTADFVLDYTPKQNSLEMEQTASIPDFDTSSMLLNAIDEMLKLRAPLEINKNLIQVVQKIVGKQKQVSNYTDYESGLKSANHFIFN